MGEVNLPKVLILKPPPIFYHCESHLSRHFHFYKAYESPLPTHIFLTEANTAGVTAILTGGNSFITAADVLDHLPSLLCIVTDSTAVHHIDLAECRRRGIAVAYAADVYSIDCADFAVGLLMDVLRKISCGDRVIRNRRWNTEEGFFCGSRLRGKKIGIVGFGNIGFRVAKRMESFGCTISYNSRAIKPSVSYPFYSSVREMATKNDVLVICCSLTTRTKHIINKEVLSALGSDGVIINVGRGPIIDENELVKFLREGKIRGAGLDVFEEEPSVPEELFSLDNVVLSPHRAYFTSQSINDVFELVKGNLEAFFSNKPLLTPVMID